MSITMTADEVIERLALAPHPEGGHYRETWRHVPADGARGSGTAIFFLLAAGERSRWHRLDATEIWHWYAGAPLVLELAVAAGTRRDLLLGPELAAGALPQRVVAAGEWQAAYSTGAWTLVGCTVSPAFEFGGFELAAPGFAPRSRG
jgi:predicted cupin superfamily sugar epimerase